MGLELKAGRGHVAVAAPIEGTPADHAGIREGDEILAIDGESVDYRNVPRAVLRMRGPAGTLVSLTVARDGHAEPLAFQLRRSAVDVHSVGPRSMRSRLCAYLAVQ